MPRDGTLESLSGFYTNLLTATLLLGASATVELQIFRRPATDPANTNVFVPYGPVLELAPSFTGVIVAGQTAAGTVDLGSLPVFTGDRLVLVACVETEDVVSTIDILTALTGYISAGLEIA